MVLSPGTIQPHELRQFIMEKVFISSEIDPFKLFQAERQKTIQDIIDDLGKSEILVYSHQIVDAFCLDTKNPKKAVAIYDNVLLPLSFTRETLRKLNENNFKVTINFLFNWANTHGIYLTRDELLGII